MSKAEHVLLLHRLRRMADIHERAREIDDHADTADALAIAIACESVLCPELLREAIAVLEAAA